MLLISIFEFYIIVQTISLMNQQKIWVDFVKIKYYLNGNFELHYMQLELFRGFMFIFILFNITKYFWIKF
jgi:hypothetical protein